MLSQTEVSYSSSYVFICFTSSHFIYVKVLLSDQIMYLILFLLSSCGSHLVTAPPLVSCSHNHSSNLGFELTHHEGVVHLDDVTAQQ